MEWPKESKSDTTMGDVDWKTVSNNNYSENATLIQKAYESRKPKNSYEEDFEKSLKETLS